MDNIRAFLDMIAFSEIGPALLSKSDNGYNVIVGSTPSNPILFHNYKDHPRKSVLVRPGLVSTAAGRYQILAKCFDFYRTALHLKDFSAESQDAIAIRMIKECRAYIDIDEGRVQDAIRKTKSRWASFPGSGYGQHEHKMQTLVDAYINAGGKIA